MAFLLQLLGSVIAVALLTALAAWAKIARDAPPLDAATAERLFAEEFPDHGLTETWISEDREVALARARDHPDLLVIHRAGDGYVAATAATALLARARREGDGVVLPLGPGRKPLRFAAGGRWSPFANASAP